MRSTAFLSVLLLKILSETSAFLSTSATTSSSSTSCTQLRSITNEHVDSDVIIIGGGLVGLAAGVALSELGVTSVQIYEQARSLRKVGAAIGLYPNGLAALGYISPRVLETIRSTSSPCHAFERRDLRDEVVQVTDVPKLGATSPIMYAWFLLQQHLADALPEDCLKLGHVLESYQVLENGLVRVTCKRDDAIITKTCRVLIGADGIHSRIRRQLLGGPPTAQYYGKVMYRAILGKHEIDSILDLSDGIQISWQGTEKGKSFSIRETTVGVVTITAAAVLDHAESDNDEGSRKQHLRYLFREFPAPVQQIMARLTDDIHEDFVRDVNIPEHWSDPDGGPVVIIGDAAHAMTPHMGQGANMGLEDVCELVDRIVVARHNRKDDDDVVLSTALADFCDNRRPRVEEVQARSRQNTLQSNTFDKQTASIPFERRKYSESFKERLYNWKPPMTPVETEIQFEGAERK